MKHDAVAVVDFGGQYAHLIATKVRRHRVLAEILQPEDPVEKFAAYKGIILSGSPSLSSHGEDSDYTKAVYELEAPILGLCFGHQEIAKHYGGEVIHGGREWGAADFELQREHPLFKGIPRHSKVWMSHFDSVAAVGPDFEELGISWLGDGEQRHRYAAIGSDKHRRYGFQYHPEVDDTEFGDRMLANFVLEICGCRPSWTMDRYIEEQMARITAQVGDDSVFLLASGGVDSTVAAILLGRALGEERLHFLHVDNGLMRKDESREVLGLFRRLGLDRNLHFIDATADFLGALAGATEPEQKRAIIGNTFVAVFQREATRLGIADHLLGQGTIYPDTIETGGTRRADTIKTHHNRVPIIEEMIAAGKVIEPLADLYKVEVRELGEKLGVPHDLVWRHPFPGPGLGVRLLCSDGRVDPAEVAEPRRQARTLAAAFGLDADILPIRSVGVKADLRCYEHPVLLHGAADFDTLLEAAGTILRRTEGVNRCVWNLAEAMPQTMSLLPATVTRERLDLLREADHLVMDGLRRHGLYDEIWQCPTVLVPLSLDDRGRETVIVRPIYSERAMTASPARLTPALLDELRRHILALPGVSGLMLDITTKPPATIEWE